MKVIALIICIFLSSSGLRSDYDIKISDDCVFEKRTVQNLVSSYPETLSANELILRLTTDIDQLGHKQGYIDCETDVFYDTDSVLCVNVNSGPLYKIDIVEFNFQDNNPVDGVYNLSHHYHGKPVAEKILKGILIHAVEHCAQNGYPFAQAELAYIEKSELETVNLKIKIIPGPQVLIDSLSFVSKSPLSHTFMMRISGIKPHALFDQKNIEKSLTRINCLSYLDVTDQPAEIYYDNYHKCHLVYEIEQIGKNRLEGAFGYSPETANQKGFVFGFLDLAFLNPIGDGKNFYIKWNRSNQNSSQLDIVFEYPYPFGSVFESTVQLAQSRLSDYYLALSAKTDLSFNLADNNKITFSIGWTKVSASGDIFRSLYNSRIYEGAIGISWYNGHSDYLEVDTRDFMAQINYLHKRLYSTLGQIPVDNSLNPIKVDLTLQYGLALNRNIYSSVKIHGSTYSEDESMISPAEMIKLGGRKTVRGYFEEQYFTPRAVWVNIESGFYKLDEIQVYLLYDMAYARLADLFGDADQSRYENKFLSGAGLGFRVLSNRTRLDFSIAWAKENKFAEGKLYLTIQNQF